MGHPDEPESPPYTVPSYVADNQEDVPVLGQPITAIGGLGFPELVFGAATMSTIYNPDHVLQSDMPLRTLRLALRYGMKAIDTSPYYGDSEIVVGSILRHLSTEFPRWSYKLVSKCGRYGSNEFDYTPATIRKSVLRSLQRLGTDYLDVLFLHDVDFVASPMHPIPNMGNHTTLWDNAEEWGLIPGKEGKAWGTGDRRILEALAEMRKLKQEGLVRAIGISGYVLPCLYRLALLVLNTTPNQPLDALLSFSHYTLQNSALAHFLPLFVNNAKIPQVFCASPLSMGLLTETPPTWHPAPLELLHSKNKAQQRVKDWPGGLINLSLGFGLNRDIDCMGRLGRAVATVAGLSNVQEVHEVVAIWREVNSGEDNTPRKFAEGLVKQIFADDGFLDWSWTCPPLRQDLNIR